MSNNDALEKKMINIFDFKTTKGASGISMSTTNSEVSLCENFVMHSKSSEDFVFCRNICFSSIFHEFRSKYSVWNEVIAAMYREGFVGSKIPTNSVIVIIKSYII